MRKLSLTVFLLSYISSKEENTKFSISLMKKNAKEITPLVNLVFISFSSNEIKCRTPLLATFCQLLANMQHCPSLTLKLVSMNFFVKINTSSILKKKKNFRFAGFWRIRPGHVLNALIQRPNWQSHNYLLVVLNLQVGSTSIKVKFKNMPLEEMRCILKTSKHPSGSSIVELHAFGT